MLLFMVTSAWISLQHSHNLWSHLFAVLYMPRLSMILNLPTPILPDQRVAKWVILFIAVALTQPTSMQQQFSNCSLPPPRRERAKSALQMDRNGKEGRWPETGPRIRPKRGPVTGRLWFGAHGFLVLSHVIWDAKLTGEVIPNALG